MPLRPGLVSESAGSLWCQGNPACPGTRWLSVCRRLGSSDVACARRGALPWWGVQAAACVRVPFERAICATPALRNRRSARRSAVLRPAPPGPTRRPGSASASNRNPTRRRAVCVGCAQPQRWRGVTISMIRSVTRLVLLTSHVSHDILAGSLRLRLPRRGRRPSAHMARARGTGHGPGRASEAGGAIHSRCRARHMADPTAQHPSSTAGDRETAHHTFVRSVPE